MLTRNRLTREPCCLKLLILFIFGATLNVGAQNTPIPELLNYGQDIFFHDQSEPSADGPADACFGTKEFPGNPVPASFGVTSAINDDCANAISLDASSFYWNLIYGTVNNATSSGLTSCIGVPVPDVWFSFVATATDQNITVQGVVGFDAAIDLREGACNGASIACRNETLPSSVEVLLASGLTIGNTYYIRVFNDPAYDATSDQFLIGVTKASPPPANDNCANTTGGDVGANGSLNFSGNSMGATYYHDGDLTVPGAWESFTLTECVSSLEVNWCGGDTVRNAGSFGIYYGCPYTYVRPPITGLPAEDCDDGSWVINYGQFEPGTYYIGVTDVHYATGNYNINILPGDACPSAPYNDDCSNATGGNVSPNGEIVFSGTSTGATNNNQGTFQTPAVWESFTLTECVSSLVIDWCDSEPARAFSFAPLAISCPYNGFVQFPVPDTGISNDCDNGSRRITFGTIAAGTYYIAVVETALANGPYTVKVQPGDACTTLANNNPCDAITLTCNQPIEATTNTATSSLGPLSCGGFPASPAQDVWFDFTADGSSTYSIETATGFDAVIALYSNDCDEPIYIDCADNTVNAAPEILELEDLDAGNYLVRVYRYSGTGNFNITLNCSSQVVPPYNDDCANTTGGNVGPNGEIVFTGNSTGATASNQGEAGLPSPVAWESFTLTECVSSLVVDWCGSDPARSSGYFGLFVGCPYTNIISPGDGLTNDCDNGSYHITYGNISAGTYYIGVNESAISNGPYTISVQPGNPCPPNQSCATAQLLDAGSPTCTPVDGTSFGANIQALSLAGCETFGEDVYYRFVATATTHQITVDGSEDYDAVINFRTGICGGSSISCTDETGPGGTEVVTATNLIVGAIYRIRVHHSSQNTPIGTSFTICVTAPDCNGNIGGDAFIDTCGNCVGGSTGETACTADCNGDLGGSATTDDCGECVGGNTGQTACIADCNGDFGGTAFTDDCDVCVGGATGETACLADCNGDFGGTAFLDECQQCVGGDTGETACVEDCNNEYGGTAFLDDCNDCVGGNTGLTACVQDCNGEFGGTAFLDECEVCVGGDTGETACVEDCNNEYGGTAYLDNCGTCVGGTTGEVPCVADCDGVPGGSAFLDNCNECVGGDTGLSACIQDCNGAFGGTAFLDECEVCVGGDTGETACVEDCNNEYGGTAYLDNCGTCVSGTTGEIPCVADCEGVPGGSAFLDDCNECVGGTTGDVACVEDCNGEFGGTAFIDQCQLCVGGSTGETACVEDCDGVFGGSALPGTACVDDAGADGILNPNCVCEATAIPGCTNPDAINYNPDATEDDGSCEFEEEPVLGCTDADAINYNPEATEDDGSCEYEEECTADAGMIATDDETTICADSEATIEVYFTEDPSDDYVTVFAITDDAANPEILSVYQMMPEGGFGFDQYTGMNFQIWAINVEAPNGTLDALLAAIANGESPEVSDLEGLCWAASNPIAVTVEVCEEPVVMGCTDADAINYNPLATEDDGSCEYEEEPVLGCTDETAINYNPEATEDDGSCEYDGEEPGCYAASVLEYIEGTQLNGDPIWADRVDPNAALGEPDRVNAVGGFVSLGYGGSISLAFGGQVIDQPGDDILVWETSYGQDGCNGGGNESAHIELSQDGINWVAAGTICRDGAVDIAVTGLAWVAYIKIINDAASTTFDGYDVDGVEAVNGCDAFEPSDECFGSEALSYMPGPQGDGSPITDPERLDPTKALGAPQFDDTFNFVSLGYGGELVIGFDGAVLNGPGADILVAETTFNGFDFVEWPESADVYVSQNGTDFFMVGSMTTSQIGLFDITAAGQGFEYIVSVKVVDTTPDGSVSDDGFDVDAVEALNGCGPVPEIITGECYATEVVEYVEGTTSNGGTIAANRTDPTQALGEPEGTDALVFVTLGYDGSLTLGFDGSVPNGPGADLEIVETTFNFSTCENYPEYADVYVSQNGTDFFSVGTVCRDDNFVDIDDAGEGFDYINYVKIVNNNTQTTSPDGFDVDGIRAIHNCADEDDQEGSDLVLADEASVLTSQPNPTNGPSVAVFTVVETAPTTLEVFDMNGRNLSTLFNQVANEGQEYRIDFEGTFLPNGVYIYRLTTGNEIIVDKMMIAR